MNIAPLRSSYAGLTRTPTLMHAAMAPASLEMKDVSSIGGAVIGGVWGYTFGNSLSFILGKWGGVACGALGAYGIGNWGYAAGFKHAACVAGCSIALGQLCQRFAGPAGGLAGAIAGSYLGEILDQKIGHHSAPAGTP